jgi:hypothetical protein
MHDDAPRICRHDGKPLRSTTFIRSSYTDNGVASSADGVSIQVERTVPTFRVVGEWWQEVTVLPSSHGLVRQPRASRVWQRHPLRGKGSAYAWTATSSTYAVIGSRWSSEPDDRAAELRVHGGRPQIAEVARIYAGSSKKDA